MTAKAEAKGVKGYFMLVESNGDDMKQIASLLESGAVQPHVSKTFPFEQMREAHLEQETEELLVKS